MTNPVRILGKVFLVGAGPGDPELITLRGMRLLQAADVILYDYLANPQLLKHARADAELICLGRHGRDRIVSQTEINASMVRFAGQGKQVVRLKGGDPAVFARASDEINALVAAGIKYEIVPGITAALAAGSYADVPITQRDAASCVALVTGHEQDDKSVPAIDFAALAQFPGTLVFYMGVTTAREWTGALIAAGKPADTPAVIVRRCTWPDQRIIRCTLATVAEELEAAKLRPPIVTIVGTVAGISATQQSEIITRSVSEESGVEKHIVSSWFTQRSLFGKRVMVTRPIQQADELASLLAEQGADCVVQPAIVIGPPHEWSTVDQAIDRLHDFDWLVFSSANGVQAFLGRLFSRGLDLRALGKVRLAAIGPGTAEALAAYHLNADLQPAEFRAEALAAALIKLTANSQSDPQRLLLLRASRGREVLAEMLTDAGHQVEQVVVYRSEDVEQPNVEVAELLASGKIDVITVTSSAIARSLAKLFGENLRRAQLASISPITSAVLRELGYPPAIEATDYTMPGLVEAILVASK